MKNILFIIGLLLSVVLFVPEEGAEGMREDNIATRSAIMQEQGSADTQRHFEMISNDLKSCNCLTPRRVFQPGNNTFDLKSWKTTEKMLQDMRLRSENQIHKASQHTSFHQALELSTLVCRGGEHVYALRKLIL